LECLALYFTGNKNESYWQKKPEKSNLFFVKGICEGILKLAGLKAHSYSSETNGTLDDYTIISSNGTKIAEAGSINKSTLAKFSIKQGVFYLNINWEFLVSSFKNEKISFKEIPKYPNVQRDLSIVVDKKISYQALENAISSLAIKKLSGFKLFDVFESEKLGNDKKSLAISFTFSDKDKTLTDDETDAMIKKIINSIEKNLGADIRNN